MVGACNISFLRFHLSTFDTVSTIAGGDSKERAPWSSSTAFAYSRAGVLGAGACMPGGQRAARSLARSLAANLVKFISLLNLVVLHAVCRCGSVKRKFTTVHCLTSKLAAL